MISRIRILDAVFATDGSPYHRSVLGFERCFPDDATCLVLANVTMYPERHCFAHK